VLKQFSQYLVLLRAREKLPNSWQPLKCEAWSKADLETNLARAVITREVAGSAKQSALLPLGS
jgi:hypothetical protein